MKVLYVASNPRREPGAIEGSLMLEREITELQKACDGSQYVHFTFLPEISVEELVVEIGKSQPDILHISGHGNASVLEFSNRSRKPLRITAELLAAILPPNALPRLIYLNACDSASIATELCRHVPMAIGTTAPVSNRAALTSVTVFYQRLLAGMSVRDAVKASSAVTKILDGGNVETVLRSQPGIDPGRECFHVMPRIVARFEHDDPTPPKSGVWEGHYEVEFGIIGCPSDLMQAIFFTTDASFIEDEDELEENLCHVVRDQPVRGVLWGGYAWPTTGDIPIYAAAATASGSIMLSSTLCRALELGFSTLRRKSSARQPKAVRAALEALRQGDGSGLPTGVGRREAKPRSR